MILVFAGAGASKAVNANEYPTTVEFYDRLPTEIIAAPLFKQLLEYLPSASPADSPTDIEKVLWALNDLSSFLQAATGRDQFPGWLLSHKRLSFLAPREHVDYSFRQVFDMIGRDSNDLTSRINQQIYTLYQRLPSDEELQATWLPLLSRTLSLGGKVDVFTTNYDLVLEQAIAIAGLPIETGRTRGVTTTLSVDLWDIAEPAVTNRKTGLFTKLHGSIDWIRGQTGEIYVGTPEFTGSHQKHAIIYPGFKGAPHHPPFTHFHQYLGASAASAAAAIFVGFAFRDEYISSVVRERLRSGIPIVVIGRGDQPPDLPFRSGQYRYFGDGFDDPVAREALAWIEKSIAT